MATGICDRKRLSQAVCGDDKTVCGDDKTVCGDDKMVTCMLPDALLVSAHRLTVWDWICIDSLVVGHGLQINIDFAIEDLPIAFGPYCRFETVSM